ncbi:MAG TPA: phospholipid carrier-dependent glycosyltransferase [Acidimicrobiales bacterium]
MAEELTHGRHAAPRLTPRQRWAVAALVLVVVVVRVALVLAVHADDPDRVVENDTAGYVDPARSLLEDGDYDRRPDTEWPEFVRTPGYPVFVAAAWFVSGESTPFLLAAQAALGSLAVLFVVLLGLRLTRSFGIAFGSGVLVAVDPLQTAQSGLIVTEAIATALTTLALYLGVRFVESGFSVRWGALYATALAAATYVRPATYYFWILVVLALGVGGWLHHRRRARAGTADGAPAGDEPGRRAVDPARTPALGRAILAVALPSLVLLGAWNVRNHFAAGSWRFSGVEAINLYWYKAGALEAAASGEDLETTQVRLTEELNHDVPPFDYEAYRAGTTPPAWGDRPGEYYERAQSEAMAILLDDPVGTAGLVAEGIYGQVVQSGWRFAWQVLTGEAPPRPVELAGLLAVWTTEALAAVGVVVALRRGSVRTRLAHLLTLGLLGFVVLASALGPDAAGGYRFRSPLWPTICLYAVLGAAHLATWWRDRRAVGARPGPGTGAEGSGAGTGERDEVDAAVSVGEVEPVDAG